MGSGIDPGTVASPAAADRAGPAAVPEDFLWGVATAGYQVEGGITNNDWNTFTTNPAIVTRVRRLGKVVGEQFNLLPAGEAVRHFDLSVLSDDLDRAKLLGLNAYRFSVEWSRVEPVPGAAPAALEDYYVPLVRELRQRGMTPVVTLSHLTLPAWVLTPPANPIPNLSDPAYAGSLRGWENADTVTAFISFVRKVVTRLNVEGVRYWITLNEPAGSTVGVGYIAGIWSPGFVLDGGRAKQAYFNLLRAHVQAYDAIKAIDAGAQISIAHNMTFFNAVRPGLGGMQVAARDQQEYFYNTHFLNSVVSGTVDKKFDRRRSPDDRHPDETSEGFYGIPAKEWRPKLDFVGINYYRSVYAYYSPIVALAVPFIGGEFDNDLHKSSSTHNLLTDLGWEISPSGFLETMRTVHASYGLPIIITENGVGEAAERYRPPYLTAHLTQVEQAIAEGIPVKGYFHWSLLDNFEWHLNYQPPARFGLCTVDRVTTFQNGTLALSRRLTESALAMQHAIAHGATDASSRWGSVEPGGRWIGAQTMSPGQLWQGAAAEGPRLALYLAMLDDTPLTWLGMIFDYATCRWTRLDKITWMPAKRELIFSHEAKAGVPDRTYIGVVRGDQMAGTYVVGGLATPWAVDRVLPQGVWQTSLPFGPIALSNIGKWESPGAAVTETWTGRLQAFASGVNPFPMEGVVAATVSWQDPALILAAEIPHPQTKVTHHVVLSARVTREQMTGSVVAAGGYPDLAAGTNWQANRVGDGIPF